MSDLLGFFQWNLARRQDGNEKPGVEAG